MSARTRFKPVLSSLLVGAVLALAGVAHAADKAIFSITENDEAKWNLALNNARNLQRGTEGTGGTEIEIVAFGPGVLTLKDGSRIASRIHEAVASGVKVVACKNSMAGAQLSEDDMLRDIGFVTAGVVELMRKEQQGYAYIRP